MKNNSAADYAAYILLKTAGPVLRSLHPRAAFWIGRRLGEIVYTFDVRHRVRAYANLRAAFGDTRAPQELAGLTLQYYRSFGQNIVEIFLIPVIDREYARKYVSIDGLEHVAEAFRRGKGVFFVSVHEGSWELSSILAQQLNIPFSLFVREQKMPRLNGLLNTYRRAKGCRIIRREDQARELIRLIRANESCGMSIDQGGRTGVGVRFFGKDASMAPGAVRLALKYDAALVPVFSSRTSGPCIKLTIEPPVKLKRTGDDEEDIRTNLQDLAGLFEGHLRRQPQEYLWHYRIWKYSRSRDILVLSDGKTGHVRQAQALARIVSGYLKEKGIETRIREVSVGVKHHAFRALLAVSGIFTNRITCQGCLSCLRRTLTAGSYRGLAAVRCDIIISCGSSLAVLNRIMAIENQAKSFVIMKPGRLPLRFFDLAVIARHDRPPTARNVVVTQGALNLIDSGYLAEQGQRLREHIGTSSLSAPVIGMLLGGDAKGFRLTAPMVREVSGHISAAVRELNGTLLATTSRRTSSEAEDALKKTFAADERCKFLLIASERNYDFGVGGILDVSDIVVISPESISMVSEAASAATHVVVFRAPGLSRKHRAVLADLERGGFIHLALPATMKSVITQIWRGQPGRSRLNDAQPVIEGLRKIL
ncbi:MAG: ELM1/GtrOC1 family putative glycosyltransferase [Candidatus Omnitrophica bacterium]|nr:ELM1/GtrOC1 family putative glycosyltransferase [Candidatus Omnitrophota bacterium]